MSSIELPVSNTHPESPALATVSSQPMESATVTVVPAHVCVCVCACVSVSLKATYHVDRHENMDFRLLKSTRNRDFGGVDKRGGEGSVCVCVSVCV